jgi:protein involved in polysaccharide export with SLBB domain
MMRRLNMDLINFIMKGISKVLLAVTLLFNAGCETPNPLPPVEPGGGIVDMDARPVNSTDSLEPGNQITITFSGLSTVPVPYACRIREDGTISPPYLKNPVLAAGKTVGKLESELEEAYVPDIYKTINVTIKTADRFFYVGGEVRQPSRQIFIGRIMVTQAIQSAGDFTDFADQREVRVIRANGSVEIVDCKAALEDPSKDLPVYPGDNIVVERRIF